VRAPQGGRGAAGEGGGVLREEEKTLARSRLRLLGGGVAVRPVNLPRLASRSARAPGSLDAGERSAGKSAPSDLLETRRIRFQINEIWVHTFTLLLPALMLF
jgi:hypothetical protein